MISEIKIPSLGATGGDVVLTEWLAKPGDFVGAQQPLFVVSTDKAEMQVEAFRSGYLRRILVERETSVEIGSTIGLLADSLEESLQEDLPAQEIEISTQHAPSPQEDLRSLAAMYRRMVLIRRFEDHLYQLFLQGIVPGTLHQYQGQEAVAVGVCSVLRKDDVIFSTHRPVGHMIAKGVSMPAIAAELWGKATGCAGGKGGQMHLQGLDVGAFPSNAIVGANVPIATGAALGFKLQGADRVAVSFFGDGASNIGAFHEGVNLAAVKNAPVLFVCENNRYAASTPIEEMMLIQDIAARAAGYGIPGVVVDGMDVVAVQKAAEEATSRARQGLGPTLIECKTYRYAGHSRGDPGQYRTKEEMAHWREQDPLLQCGRLLIEQGSGDEEWLERIGQECQQRVEEAVAFARSSPDPAAESCFQHVFAAKRPAL